VLRIGCCPKVRLPPDRLLAAILFCNKSSFPRWEFLERTDLFRRQKVNVPPSPPSSGPDATRLSVFSLIMVFPTKLYSVQAAPTSQGPDPSQLLPDSVL